MHQAWSPREIRSMLWAQLKKQVKKQAKKQLKELAAPTPMIAARAECRLHTMPASNAPALDRAQFS